MFTSTKSHWASVAKSVRETRDQKHVEQKAYLQPLYKALSQSTIDGILSSTATQLVEGVQTGKLQSADLVLVYSWRACLAGELLNSNTEELFVEAHKYALEQDKIRAAARKSSSTPAGKKLTEYSRLLEGLPVSVKDQYQQAGCTSSSGVVSLATEDKRHHQDGVLVKLIRDQGGVPYVRSNIPQLLMFSETDNAMYGRAENPWKIGTRSPGGSSGGEGALLGANASPLGLGSDIGGSVRIPAHCSGVVGFKPTPVRNSLMGLNIPRHHAVDGMQAVRNAAGPMARYVEDCVLVLKTWWCPELYSADAYVAPMSFDDSIYSSKKKLRIGYYIQDGYFPTSKPVIRAVNEAVDALRAAGHEVVEFAPVKVKEIMLVYLALFLGDGGRSFFDALKGEAPNSRYTTQVVAKMIPNFVKPIIRRLLRLAGQHRLADLAEAGNERSTFDYWFKHAEAVELSQQFIAHVQSLNFDVWLSPTTCLPAWTHTSCEHLVPATSTLLQNVVQLPAGVVPVTVVRKDEQEYSDTFNDMITKVAKQVCADSAGLPIGVQVVGLPYKDETVLRVMKEIQDAVKFHDNFQPTETLNKLK